MKFFLCLVVLPHVRLLIREVVEVLHEFVKHLLFIVESLEESQELSLDLEEVLLHPISLDSLLAEYLHHLSFVSGASLFPKVHQHAFEVFLDVVSLRHKIFRSKLGSISY